MTDAVSTPEQDQTGQGAADAQLMPRDPRLNFMIHRTHIGAMSGLNITVIVGGRAYSGRLASLADWRAASLVGLEEGSDAWKIVEGITTIDPDIPSVTGDVAAEDLPNYPILHLADVSMDRGLAFAPLPGAVLRFAVDAIDGWMLGALG